jgi:hypothetical protein
MGAILHPRTGSRVKRVARRGPTTPVVGMPWFSAPLRGIALALALYVAGFAVALAD